MHGVRTPLNLSRPHLAKRSLGSEQKDTSLLPSEFSTAEATATIYSQANMHTYSHYMKAIYNFQAIWDNWGEADLWECAQQILYLKFHVYMALPHEGWVYE